MTLLSIHAGATLAMVGVIWFVQLVHYPLFALASERQFAGFAEAHQRRTSWVVMPLMLTELTTAVLLLLDPPLGLDHRLLWLGIGLLAFIWISTALLQVPLHQRLTRHRDLSAIHRLVATNWLRTAAWTARGALALALITQTSP
ncbi:MAG: hypothetical protein AAF481_03015 [Acidobacteriota bacterium]